MKDEGVRVPVLEAALLVGSVVGALAVLASEAGRPLRERAADSIARWRCSLSDALDRPSDKSGVSGGRSVI